MREVCTLKMFTGEANEVQKSCVDLNINYGLGMPMMSKCSFSAGTNVPLLRQMFVMEEAVHVLRQEV